MSTNNDDTSPARDRQPATDSTPQAVHTPVRELTTPSLDLSALESDVTVRNNGGGNFEFDVTLWNLARDTWQTILTDGTIDITLGWEDGPTDLVCTGTIDTTNVTQSGADTAYSLYGRDRTAQRLQTRRTATWHDVSLSQVVRDLAAACDLSVGLLPPRTEDIRFDAWTIGPERRIGYWFDQLAAEATRQTDRAWEWYGEAGAVSVVPRRQTEDTVLELSRNGSLLVFEPTASPNANPDPDTGPTAPADAGGFARQFSAYLEPHIGRDRRVRVSAPDSDDDAPLYRVTSYTFRSGSTAGVHHVNGEMVPVGRPAGASETQSHSDSSGGT